MDRHKQIACQGHQGYFEQYERTEADPDHKQRGRKTIIEMQFAVNVQTTIISATVGATKNQRIAVANRITTNTYCECIDVVGDVALGVILLRKPVEDIGY